MRKEVLLLTTLVLVVTVVQVYAAVPVVQSAQINTSYTLNTTGENVSLAVNITDADNQSVKPIVDWQVDNQSFVILNLPFEKDGDLNSTDYSTNNYSAISVTAPYWPAGGYDGRGAYEFRGSGSGDEIDLGTWNITGNFTVEAWVYPRSVNTESGIITKWFNSDGRRSWLLDYDDNSGNKLKFCVSNLGTNFYCRRTTVAPPLNVWQHFAASWNGSAGGIAIYVDGVKQTLENSDISGPTVIGAPFATDSIVYVGRHHAFTGVADHFDGWIDDVRIYDRVLNDDQIMLLYANNTNVILPDTIRAGETVRACARGHDNDSVGNLLCSNSILISEVNRLLGNESNVTATGLTALNVTVDLSDTLLVDVFETKTVQLFDENFMLANITNDFLQQAIDLAQVSLQKTAEGLVVDLNGQLAGSKTLYLEDPGTSFLCVKDAEISSLGEISPNCQSANEIYFSNSECVSNSTKSGITCRFNGSVYSVENLTSSGVLGIASIAVPEFTDYVLMILLGTALAGISLMRKRGNLDR